MNSLKQFFYNLYYVNVGGLFRNLFYTKKRRESRSVGMRGEEKIISKENAGGDLRRAI